MNKFREHFIITWDKTVTRKKGLGTFKDNTFLVMRIMINGGGS